MEGRIEWKRRNKAARSESIEYQERADEAKSAGASERAVISESTDSGE